MSIKSLNISRLTLFFLSISCSLFSQDWQGIGHFTGENMLIMGGAMATDSAHEFLYFGGSYSMVVDQNNDTTLLQSMGKWDGAVFSTITDVELSSDQVGYIHSSKSVRMLNNQLFARRAMAQVSMPWIEQDTIEGPIGKLIDGQWFDLVPQLEKVTGPFMINGEPVIFEDQNQIPNQLRYAVLGDPLEIGEYNPTTHEVFADFAWGKIYSAVVFEDYLYLAGNLSITPQSDIIRLNTNGESDIVGDGISGPVGLLNAMQIYNGQLIVGGGFSKEIEGGSTIYNIAAWDGQSWSSVFGLGVNGSVLNMKVYDGILYILGNFTYAYLDEGLYPASRILAYDGEQVYRISEEVFLPGQVVSDLIFFRDTMYISGSFEWIHNYPVTSIAKRISPLPTALSSELLLHSKLDVTCFPNPAGHTVGIRFDRCCFSGVLEIFNAVGTVVRHKSIQNRQEFQLDISDLDQGMYIFVFRDQSGDIAIKRIVVEK